MAIEQKEMDAKQLDALGEQMSAAFDEAITRGYESPLPKGIETSADSARQSSGSTRPERPAKRRAARHRPAH
jgi:hypothetical protein